MTDYPVGAWLYPRHLVEDPDGTPLDTWLKSRVMLLRRHHGLGPAQIEVVVPTGEYWPHNIRVVEAADWISAEEFEPRVVARMKQTVDI